MTTTTMATTVFPIGLRIYSPQQSIQSANMHLPPFAKQQTLCLNLRSSHSISGLGSPVLSKHLTMATPLNKSAQTLKIVWLHNEGPQGNSLDFYQASAKRFRVSGSGEIMRRRAGKQHLLRKKNAKRRNRLSKAVQVDRCDYNNVIGALPYLKVNRSN